MPPALLKAHPFVCTPAGMYSTFFWGGWAGGGVGGWGGGSVFNAAPKHLGRCRIGSY